MGLDFPMESLVKVIMVLIAVAILIMLIVQWSGQGHAATNSLFSFFDKILPAAPSPAPTPVK